MSSSLDRFRKLEPGPVSGNIRELVDKTFMAYNSARLGEACRVFEGRFTDDNVTVGVSAAGALTPAGLGVSCLVPLMKAGLVDWMVFTGATCTMTFISPSASHCIGAPPISTTAA